MTAVNFGVHNRNRITSSMTLAVDNCELFDLTSEVFQGENMMKKMTCHEKNNNSCNDEKSDEEISGEVPTSDINSNNVSDEEQEDLTSLTWLTELKNLTNLPPTQSSDQLIEKTCDPPSQRFEKFINQVKKIKESYMAKSIIYQTVAVEKPPYNYAQIIAMAMIDQGRMTLKQICDWIEDHFAYYRDHRNWNNSIRHNLSLNFFFSKVARGKNEKGKGGYWELAVDTSKTLRKRVRNRKKKGHAFFKSNRSLLKSKSSSANFTRNKKCNKMSQLKVGSEKICSDVFFSNYSSSIKEKSIMSSPHITTTEIEIIEEQQNINNIIDDANNAILISNGNLGNPKVIVQEINQQYQFTSFNQINFDENELSEIICLNDQDLIDDLFNYSHNGNEVEELI